MRTTSNENVGESPLLGVRYPASAMALWRWRDAAEDTAVHALLARCAQADPVERARLRATLSVEDFFTLVTFAQRSVLAALRTEVAERVSEGWTALALIDVNRCADPRDVWMAARLVRYATDRLDLDPGPASRTAFELADPDTAELLAEVIADDEADLTADCGMREVRTATGPILVDDDDETYLPDTDLLDIALRLTVVLAEHGYTNASITIATAISQHWLANTMPAKVRAATDTLTGCVSIHTDPLDDHTSSLLVFVGEAPTPNDSALIATSMETTRVADCSVVGRAAGRLCAIMVATPRHARGVAEIPQDSLVPLADHVAVLLR